MTRVFTGLLTSVETPDGMVLLNKGDAIPANANKEQVARLDKLGRIGSSTAPADTPSDDEDPAGSDVPGPDATVEDFAAWIEGDAKPSADDVVAAAGEDPARAALLLEAEQQTKARKTAVEPLEKLANG